MSPAATPPPKRKFAEIDPVSKEFEEYARKFHEQMIMFKNRDPRVFKASLAKRQAVQCDLADCLDDLVRAVHLKFEIPCLFRALADAHRRIKEQFHKRLPEHNIWCVMCGCDDVSKPERDEPYFFQSTGSPDSCRPCRQAHETFLPTCKEPRCKDCGFVHTWASDSIFGPDLVALAGAVYSRGCTTLSALGRWMLKEALSVFARCGSNEDAVANAVLLGKHFASNPGPLDRMQEADRESRMYLRPPVVYSFQDLKCRAILTMLSYPEYFPMCFVSNLPMRAWNSKQVRPRVQ